MAFPKEERDDLRRMHAEAHCDGWQYDDEQNNRLLMTVRNRLPRLLDALDAAEAERDKAREHDAQNWKLILRLREILKMQPLEDITEKAAQIEAERDALKAKLAALVAEVDDIVTHGIDDADDTPGYSSEFAIGCLSRALAAAKVQP